MIKGREEEAVDKKRGGMPNYERSEWENPRKGRKQSVAHPFCGLQETPPAYP